MKLCAIVPSYRHAAELPRITESLRAQCGLVLVVDDGNPEPWASDIARLHAPERGVEVIRLLRNGGKGAAVQAGFREAIARGFTHALQIDADGQHDVGDVPRFIAAARGNPAALVCGRAVFDASAPPARKIGRWVTHVWVWIETLSLDIADSMCGFRIYPLDAVAGVLDGGGVGRGMDFDTEIAVRLHWRGTPVVNLPTRVIYPAGNSSSFRMLEDNVAISAMHTRLALQAPVRLVLRLLRPRRDGRLGRV